MVVVQLAVEPVPPWGNVGTAPSFESDLHPSTGGFVPLKGFGEESFERDGLETMSALRRSREDG